MINTIAYTKGVDDFDIFKKYLGHIEDVKIIIEPGDMTRYEMYIIDHGFNEFLLVFPKHGVNIVVGPHWDIRLLHDKGITNPYTIGIFGDCFKLYFGEDTEWYDWEKSYPTEKLLNILE